MQIIIALVGLALLINHQASSGSNISITPHAEFTMKEGKDVVRLALSTDGSMLLTADDRSSIECWDVETKTRRATIDYNEPLVFLAFTNDDSSCIIVDEQGTICIVDIGSSQKKTSFAVRGKPVKATLDQRKKLLAVATSDERVELFDLKTSLAVGTIDARGQIDDPLAFDFDGTGELLTAVNRDGEVFLWDVATLKLVRQNVLGGGELHGSHFDLKCVATNRAANIFAASLEEVALPKGGIKSGKDLMRSNNLIVYDWETGNEIKRVKTLWSIVQASLGPGNDYIAVTNDEDRSLTLVNLREGEVSSAVTMQDRPLVIMTSDESRYLVAGFDDGRITVWSTERKYSSNDDLIANRTTEEREYRGTPPPVKQELLNQVMVGKTRLLVIAIDNYRDKRNWKSLHNPVRDAKALKDILLKKYRFQEELIVELYDENATRDKILTELERLSKSIGRSDNLLIYFAGHGWYDGAKRIGYWIPVDGKAEQPESYIKTQDLQPRLNAFKARSVLIISDACYSATLFRGPPPRNPFQNPERYFHVVTQLKARQVITSGGKEVVMDGWFAGAKHSVFAWFLLDALESNTSSYLPASSLFDALDAPVTTNSLQKPEMIGLYDAGHNGGEFVFFKK